jgi:hypothetical protein
MPINLLDLPELEQPEEFFPFETYKNYLQSLSVYIKMHFGAAPNCFDKLKTKCIQRGIFSGVQTTTLPAGTLEKIKKLLFNAWNTELVLALPASISAEFIKFANHWSPVQAYYALYLALQAYFRSIGMQAPPRDHAASLNTISAQICVFPPFWNVCCSGEPTLKGAQYPNIPSGVVVKDISPLTTPAPQEFWDWYGMLLRTTRKRQFEKKLRDSGRQFKTKGGRPRKRFTAQQKRQVLAALRPTTVFDFLYRLRIRSNYEDADAFILGTMSQTDAREFNEALQAVTASTLFLIELHIARRLGAHGMESIIDEFMVGDEKGFSQNTLGVRRPFLA